MHTGVFIEIIVNLNKTVKTFLLLHKIESSYEQYLAISFFKYTYVSTIPIDDIKFDEIPMEKLSFLRSLFR